MRAMFAEAKSGLFSGETLDQNRYFYKDGEQAEESDGEELTEAEIEQRIIEQK